MYVRSIVYMCGTAWLTQTTFYVQRGWCMSAMRLGNLAMCDVTRLCVRHESVICVTWRLHVWHGVVDWDDFLFATWLIYVCDMTRTPSHVRRDSCMCATWYVWHDSLICVARLGWLGRRAMCDVRRDSFMCATWLGRLHKCDVTRLCVRYDLFICVTCLVYMCGTAWLTETTFYARRARRLSM